AAAACSIAIVTTASECAVTAAETSAAILAGSPSASDACTVQPTAWAACSNSAWHACALADVPSTLTKPIVSCGIFPPRPDCGAKLPRYSGTAEADCWTVTVDEPPEPPPELALALVDVLADELDFFPPPPHPAASKAIATNATTIKPEAR